MGAERGADVIVVGAGIIGAACAWRLAREGYRVSVVDDRRAGATAAGMGHLVCMDDNPAELALSAYSLRLWREVTGRMPQACAWRGCGTLWLADKADEMAIAEQKRVRLAEQGVAAELLTAEQIAAMEPMLRHGLAGGLRVPGDGILYAPLAARWLLADGGAAIDVVHGEAAALEEEPCGWRTAGAWPRRWCSWRAALGPMAYCRRLCCTPKGPSGDHRSLPAAGAASTGGVGVWGQRACQRRHVGGIQCAGTAHRAMADRFFSPVRRRRFGVGHAAVGGDACACAAFLARTGADEHHSLLDRAARRLRRRAAAVGRASTVFLAVAGTGARGIGRHDRLGSAALIAAQIGRQTPEIDDSPYLAARAFAAEELPV